MIRCCKFCLVLFNSVFLFADPPDVISVCNYITDCKWLFNYDGIRGKYYLKNGCDSDELEIFIKSNGLDVIEKSPRIATTGKGEKKIYEVWTVVAKDIVREITSGEKTYDNYDVILDRHCSVVKKFYLIKQEQIDKGYKIYTDKCVIYSEKDGDRKVICYVVTGREGTNLYLYNFCVSSCVSKGGMAGNMVTEYKKAYPGATIIKTDAGKVEYVDSDEAFEKILKCLDFDGSVIDDNSSPSDDSGPSSGSSSNSGASSSPKKKKKCCCC